MKSKTGTNADSVMEFAKTLTGSLHMVTLTPKQFVNADSVTEFAETLTGSLHMVMFTPQHACQG